MGASVARQASNTWIANAAKDVEGKVLSIGSGNDLDWQGSRYRNYFPKAEYFTSDITTSAKTKVNLIIDVRSMPQVEDASYDCVFIAGVLEHVDDIFSAMSEVSRILKPGGLLLLGVPFGQPIHRAPQDFWRLTIHGLEYLLDRYGFVLNSPIAGIPGKIPNLASVYWSESRKIEKDKTDE